MEYLVIRVNDVVPLLGECRIHLFGGIVWTITVFDDILVMKVVIRDDEIHMFG